MVNKISKQQREFLDWEFGVFFHFGIRTFYEGHKDWDMKPMDVSGFNPTGLDCESWIKTIKQAGARYAILVAKHHDGFALWPSEYTDYGVKSTPWKDGKGDVVREYVDACRKHDIKVGIYYSPAQFGTREMDGDKYCDYFIGQLSELLLNYGKIDYLWFDGCGSDGIEYDKARIVKTIRSIQPEILIFNMWDPDTRWIGNERGFVPLPNYNYVGKYNNTLFDELLEQAGGRIYAPAECDFKIREKNWFYSDFDEDSRKTLDELLGIYYMSVGRGANFLINIAPDRSGLLPKDDAKLLLQFGEEVRRRFSKPLEPVNVIREGNSITLEFNGDVLTDAVVLKEDLAAENEIDEFEISANGRDIKSYIHLYSGKTIGHKAICSFPHICTDKIVIKSNRSAEQIIDVKVYNTKK